MKNLNVESIDLIEKRLKSKKIQEYEIYFVEQDIYETEFLKNKIYAIREVTDIEYVIRILTQKGNETGIGIVKGNSLDSKEIENNIAICQLLSKENSSSKYYFPVKNAFTPIKTADDTILKDPVGFNEEISSEIRKEIDEHKEVSPTFGRFRIHIQDKILKNSSGLELNASKTFFYMEYALKAQEMGKLAEAWEIEYIKEKEQLNIEDRVNKWARIAVDTLRAKIPKPNTQAIVIFPPNVLKNAINSVIGFHALGKAYHEKVSTLNVDAKVASDTFTLIDDGLLEGGLMCNSWDGEGNPHQTTEVIKNGIFKERLYDQKFAIIGNANSTGNGIRMDDGSIINSISNLEILSGDITKEEMISNIKEGYFIEKCSWLNPDRFSGSFGTEIRNGYFIKNGQLEYPIKGGNISGNVLEMIKNCHQISKEREFSLNSLFPYITFKNLSISS
ncbi:MAG: TldD/PmbA family protein [Promethearchaeota archaeon]|nr:MAG: TldD/PmbA family protein [Candidatus Lokiarchaeota archaeon]